MKIQFSSEAKNLELPLQLNISFKKVYNMIKDYASEQSKNHPFYASANIMVKKVKQYPELIEGFSDLSLLEEHKEIIDFLLDGLFPIALTNNEIKAATIPFSFISFKFTQRFKDIIKNAGENFELKVRNFEDDVMYIHSCTLILAYYYNYFVDLKRPFFFDIPDVKQNIIKHYRVAFNGDFMDVYPTNRAPKITEEDIKLLLDNFDNIEMWKEKFPPNSYTLNGFGIMNLFDVTADETISAIQNDLLRADDNLMLDLQKHLGEFFKVNDLKIGYSMFNEKLNSMASSSVKKSQSLMLKASQEVSCANDAFFCKGIIAKVFHKKESIAISDLEKYGKQANYNQFYVNLKKENIGSIILLPIQASKDSKEMAVLEIASPRAYELNSLNQNKLKDLIPVFKSAIKRSIEEYNNVLEATIQEYYTSIHPTVKWRFYEAAEKFQLNNLTQNESKIEDIVFNNVYPLFGQSDIKGSSIARNNAIKKDLTTQLSLAISILEAACKVEKLPIYEELMFRVSKYLKTIKEGLKAGDEIGILDFLKREIYPVFTHVKKLNTKLNTLVTAYMNRLDTKLHVVYEERKNYEDSVTILNNKLAKFIDKKQEEAQQMFPHYFERYKTDGVEYNMYIGQSLTNEQKFDTIYLHNLRLWQLQLMCEMENVANKATSQMKHKLRVASLVLVHSTPLAIKFRMDEKQFDVDGAYNIRYEIIKKRIDKANIKGTKERLTTPGKIAIVYSQDKDAKEYLKYINYLQSKNMLGQVEMLDIEDLQGVSGLKALRVEVVYKDDFSISKTISIEQLLEEFN